MALSWTPLHARLHQVLRSRHLLPKGQRILIAVSGGQDSLCLARLLLDLQSRWDWTVAIAHCNHRWRKDADENAAYVAGISRRWGVSYYGLTIEASQQDAIATEAGARKWRYEVLTKTAIAHRFTAITTGHTASDRAETLLYNLMRGSGTDGLQALTWQRALSISSALGTSPLNQSATNDSPPSETSDSEDCITVSLVRPLLFMQREETGEFCRQAGLEPWYDQTNDDWHYARNRIRQDLLPYLQQHFNPSVEHTLAQTAEILQAEVAYLEAETDRLWHQVVATPVEFSPSTQASGGQDVVEPWDSLKSPPQLQINRNALMPVPLALQRRIMRRCLLHLLPKAPNFEHIEKLTTLINAPNRSQTDPFPGGAIARVEGPWIVIKSPTLSEFG